MEWNKNIQKQLEELYKEGIEMFGKGHFTLLVHLFNDNDFRVKIEHNITSEIRIWKFYGEEYTLNGTSIKEILKHLIQIVKVD